MRHVQLNNKTLFKNKTKIKWVISQKGCNFQEEWFYQKLNIQINEAVHQNQLSRSIYVRDRQLRAPAHEVI